jgi:uncharacterized repeat protein (TIGR01451 family)
MKSQVSGIGRILRLSMMAIVLLFSQHAFAVGTDAGITIANQAQVDYDVGGIGQTFILSDPAGNDVPGVGQGASTDFMVDNRVDFTLVETGNLAHTNVSPGQQNAFVQFLLTNTGNSAQDFRLVASNLLAPAPVDLLPDTVDMNNLEIYVDEDGSGSPDLINDLDYVDELLEGASVNIYVVGDADVLFVAGDIANVDLDAIVADAGGVLVLGGDTGQDDLIVNGLLTVEVVFGDDGLAVLGDGIETAEDGFAVVVAALEITKAATLISDPFNGTTNQKAIPGAVIEYVITVDNTGGAAATNVIISDVFTDISLVSNFFGANEVEIDNDGVVTLCTEEADALPDVCVLAANTLTVGVAAPDIGLDVAGGTNMTITFRVTID